MARQLLKSYLVLCCLSWIADIHLNLLQLDFNVLFKGQRNRLSLLVTHVWSLDKLSICSSMHHQSRLEPW